MPPAMRLGPQPHFRLELAIIFSLGALVAGPSPSSHAQPQSADRNPVEALQEKLQSGQAQLQQGSGPWGYLPSLLKALDIPIDSQVLVFSKTSLQFDQINPATPRAIYFNDDTAVGGVQGGQLSEIQTSGADGQLAFYSLDTTPSPQPTIKREGLRCVSCHGTLNKWTAGAIIANVLPRDDGTPIFLTVGQLLGVTDSSTPFERRWGGWYVTGRHGALQHNGNMRLPPDGQVEHNPNAGLNVTDLSSRFDVRPYLTPTSDIVALMTLEHQVGAMNRIWTLEAQARALSGSGPQESTEGDVNRSIEDLVAYLVGAHEAPLPSPVSGVSSFTRTFPQRGPWDARGRSLRDFDLQTRLFRYPLSYVIYSRAFNSIEPALRGRIYKRLFEVLSSADQSTDFAGLTPEGKRAALEILTDTKPDLPHYYREALVR